MTCSCCSGSSTPTQSRTAYLAYCTYYVQTHRQARTGANQPTRREACCNLFISSLAGRYQPRTLGFLGWRAGVRRVRGRGIREQSPDSRSSFIHSFIGRPASHPSYLRTMYLCTRVRPRVAGLDQGMDRKEISRRATVSHCPSPP